jgi:hypothetical protein
MKYVSERGLTTIRPVVVLLGLVLLGIAAFVAGHDSAEAAGWAVGDVFAGTGSGTYDVHNNSGVFKETITQAPLGFAGTGCAFNPSLDKLYTTNFNTEVVVFNDAHPHSIVQTVDTGAQGGDGAESVVFAANGDFYVGHALGNTDIQRFNAAGVFQQQYNVPTELMGSDWIDLSADQKTMFYTSEGRRIMRYDVSGAGAPLTDFATLPGIENAFALRLLPPGDGSGGLLVADTANIKRLSAAGNVVQTYDVAGEDYWFALNLDPNGTSFWSAETRTGNFYRFNIATGDVISGNPPEVGPINATSGSRLYGLCLKGELSPGVPPEPVCITIRKITNPAGGMGFTFPWTGTTVNGVVIDAPIGFTLNDAGQEQLCGLQPGTYDFSESDTPGWSLINIVCGGAPGILIGSDNNFDFGDTSVTMTLHGGENVVCTFTNTQDITAPVGGIVGLSDAADAPHRTSGSSSAAANTLRVAALSAAAVTGALLVGGWYARRRWSR